MKDSNVVGTVEKRELAKIIEKEFDTVINNLQQEIRFTEGEILEQAEKKFGVKCLMKEIKQYEEKIRMLKKRISDIGFNVGCSGITFAQKWDSNGVYTVDKNSKAGRFYYLKLARNLDIQAIKKQRDNRLKALWLSSDRKEVKSLANGAIKPILIKKGK